MVCTSSRAVVGRLTDGYRFVREMRRHAYTQLLESYRVVSLQSMADQFGVSIEWLDRYFAPPSPAICCN